MPGERPHLLHLHMWQGEMSWRLECPYQPDDPHRPCAMVEENMARPPEPPEDRSVVWMVGVLTYMDGRVGPVPESMRSAWDAYLKAADEWEGWLPASGCFAADHLDLNGTWGEALEGLDVENPQFPLKVRPVIEGDLDDAAVTDLVLHEEEPANG